MSPLVSIIINNYNYDIFVRQAIESALVQTYPNIELIIVDDGSKDNSRAIIEEYSDRTTVMYKENGGQASAFNVGIGRACGQYALILDSDDYLFPEAIENCVREFPKGYSRVFFRLRHVDASGARVQTNDPAAPTAMIDGDILASAATGEHLYLGPQTSANFFDLRILKSVLPIPEHEYRICADAFLLARTSTLGHVKSLDLELGAYRVHADNAFFGYSSLFSNPRRIKAQIDNYFSSQKLAAEACEEVGIQRAPVRPEREFWLVHLLVAGFIWNITSFEGRAIETGDLLRAIVRHLLTGSASAPKRIAQTAYLACLVLVPRSVGRLILAVVDKRKTNRNRRLAVGLGSTGQSCDPVMRAKSR